MILTEENCSTESKTCLNASLSATKLIDLILQGEHRSEPPETRNDQFGFNIILSQILSILRRVRITEKSDCFLPHVRLSTWKIWASTGLIFMKFLILFEYLSGII